MTAEAETYSASIDDLAERDASRCGVAPIRNATVQQFDVLDIVTPITLDVSALLARNFTPRTMLLSPVLTSQSLTMVYGPRGIAKTHVAVGIAWALASGGEFLGWKAVAPVRVLYLDGEMPGADLKERVARVVASSPNESPAGYLRFMTPDAQQDWIVPNLYTPEGQAAIAQVIDDAQVIIVDNLSCLVRGGKENEGESWQPVAEWALRQRAAGRSVIFIHHAGKGGQQRGTSKREDLLDTVISLRRPSDYTADQGARFEVHFEKARALYGEDVQPFEAQLESMEDGTQAWTTRKVSDATDEQILEMAELGMSTRDIGQEVGVNYSTVARRLQRLEEEGRYVKKPRRGAKTLKSPAKAWSDTDAD